MKTAASALALLALLATLPLASVPAAAQSSATVFGVADAAVRRITSGDRTVYSLGSGGLAASRFGVRVAEDLGDGLSASAWLEGTANFDDGTTNSSRFWNRRSTVGLAGRFGELRLGHDLTPSYTAFGEFDTFGVSGLADQGKFHSTAFGSGIEGTGLWARADNMVAYYTPGNLGGFYAHLAVAAGEATAAKKYRGGRVGYQQGSLHVTAAHGVFDGIAGDLKRSSVAGTYDVLGARLFGSIVRTTYLDARRVVAQLGASVPISTAGSLRANVTRADASGRLGTASIDDDDATQYSLGYVHALSKRTTLYATWTVITNHGKANFVVATPPAVVVGARSGGTEFGISHRF